MSSTTTKEQDMRIARAERLITTLSNNSGELSNQQRVVELIDAVRVLEDHNNDLLRDLASLRLRKQQQMGAANRNSGSSDNAFALTLDEEQQLRINLARAKQLGELVNDAKTALRNQQMMTAMEQVEREKEQQREQELEAAAQEQLLAERASELQRREMALKAQQRERQQQAAAQAQVLAERADEIQRREVALKEKALEAQHAEIEFKMSRMIEEERQRIDAETREMRQQHLAYQRLREDPAWVSPSRQQQQHLVNDDDASGATSWRTVKQQPPPPPAHSRGQNPPPPPTAPQSFNSVRAATSQQPQQQSPLRDQSTQAHFDNHQATQTTRNATPTVTPPMLPLPGPHHQQQQQQDDDDPNAPRLTQVSLEPPVTVSHPASAPNPPSRAATALHRNTRHGRTSSPTRADVATAVKLPPPRARVADAYAEERGRVVVPPFESERHQALRAEEQRRSVSDRLLVAPSSGPSSSLQPPEIAVTTPRAGAVAPESHDLLDRSLASLRSFAANSPPPPPSQQQQQQQEQYDEMIKQLQAERDHYAALVRAQQAQPQERTNSKSTVEQQQHDFPTTTTNTITRVQSPNRRVAKIIPEEDDPYAAFLSLRPKMPDYYGQSKKTRERDAALEVISKASVEKVMEEEQRRRDMDRVFKSDSDQMYTNAGFQAQQLQARDRDFVNKSEYNRSVNFGERQQRIAAQRTPSDVAAAGGLDPDNFAQAQKQQPIGNLAGFPSTGRYQHHDRYDYEQQQPCRRHPAPNHMHRAPPSVGLQDYYEAPPPPPPLDTLRAQHEQRHQHISHRSQQHQQQHPIGYGYNNRRQQEEIDLDRSMSSNNNNNDNKSDMRTPLPGNKRRTLREVERASGVPQSRIRAANPALKYYDEDQIVPEQINIFVPVPDGGGSSRKSDDSSAVADTRARAINSAVPSRSAQHVPDYEQFTSGRSNYRPLSPQRRGTGSSFHEDPPQRDVPISRSQLARVVPVDGPGNGGNWVTTSGRETAQDICARFAIPYATFRHWNVAVDRFSPQERLPAGMTVKVDSR